MSGERDDRFGVPNPATPESGLVALVKILPQQCGAILAGAFFVLEEAMNQQANASLMTTSELAKESGLTPGFWYDEIRSGRIPHFRIGATGWTIRIARKDFEEWLAARRVEAPREVERPRNKPVREARRA